MPGCVVLHCGVPVQVFGYLSSPSCALFGEVDGPVYLTEEDLDLLLAAGGTSSSTLAHLRALDAQGKAFKGACVHSL